MFNLLYIIRLDKEKRAEKTSINDASSDHNESETSKNK